MCSRVIMVAIMIVMRFLLLFFSSTTSLGWTNNAWSNVSRLKLERLGEEDEKE